MPKIAKHWTQYAKLDPETDLALQTYSPVMRQLLANRGLTDAEAAARFLKAEQPPGTEPGRINDMEAAVARIIHALENAQRIAIYGDYDDYQR